MKKFLPSVFLTLFTSLYSFSQTDGLLITENFPYSNGNLTGQGSSPAWASTGTGGDVIVTALTDNSGALVYPGYTSGTSYVTTSNANTRDPSKGFIGSQTVSSANSTTFYLSFVVRVASSANTNRTNQASATVALMTSTGGNLSYFYIGDDGNGGNLKFGISKNGNAGNYASGNFLFNTTYLIVIRYNIVTGGNANDQMYLWVDPLLSSEPSTASANVSITSGNDGGISGNVSALQLLEDNGAQSGTTASLDGFKVSYGANSVTAWNDLAPQGAPLPVKFGDLKASQQSNGVRIDWSSYSEENTDHYDIERSSDGRSFSVIGQVTAKGNSSSKTDYTWLDESPLNGNNFYRVRSVDIDGHLTYSTTIKLSIGGSTSKSIKSTPIQ